MTELTTNKIDLSLIMAPITTMKAATEEKTDERDNNNSNLNGSSISNIVNVISELAT